MIFHNPDECFMIDFSCPHAEYKLNSCWFHYMMRLMAASWHAIMVKIFWISSAGYSASTISAVVLSTGMMLMIVAFFHGPGQQVFVLLLYSQWSIKVRNVPAHMLSVNSEITWYTEDVTRKSFRRVQLILATLTVAYPVRDSTAVDQLKWWNSTWGRETNASSYLSCYMITV
jgi:hypothetical protein